MRRRREILLLAVSTVVALLLAELIVAAVHPQWTARRLLESTPPNKRPSDILPFTMCKSCEGRLIRSEFDTRITINSLGLRGAEVDLGEPVGRRVLIVGDSFTYGFGVNDDETYPAVLERRLRERLGESAVQVLNGGFAAGYYPDTYYLWLKEVGLDLEPDLVIVGFYIGNDIDHDRAFEHHWPEVDADGLPLKITSPGRLVAAGYQVEAERQFRYRWPVLRNSHLFQAVMSAFAAAEGPPASEDEDEAENSSSPDATAVVQSAAADPPARLRESPEGRKPSRDAGKRAKLRPYFNRWMYRADYLPRTHARVSKVQTLLLALSEVARARDVQVAVVMIPAREQLLPQVYRFERYPFMEDYDLDKPQRIFASFFEREGIPYLDLLPLLREETRLPPLYYPADMHLTARGNEVVARHIEDFLVDRRLIAGPDTGNENRAAP